MMMMMMMRKGFLRSRYCGEITVVLRRGNPLLSSPLLLFLFPPLSFLLSRQVCPVRTSVA